MLLLASAAPLLLASTPLQPLPDPTPIVGGEPVAAGAYPEVVDIRYLGNRCSGTLLTSELILTAAHCFDRDLPNPNQIAVLTGDNSDDPDQALAVQSYGIHPDFCNFLVEEDCPGTFDLYDYAWVRLAEPLDIPPERFPTIVTDEGLHHQLVREGAEVLLVGYGGDEQLVYGRKREVTTSITAITPTGIEFRAGKDGLDSCGGDSGGPAFARLDDGSLALMGVLSRGSKECGDGGFYGATLAGLCWVAEDSGVDVAPSDCGACDCVDLTPREESGCGSCSTSEQHASWGMALVLLALFRRGRARRPGAR